MQAVGDVQTAFLRAKVSQAPAPMDGESVVLRPTRNGQAQVSAAFESRSGPGFARLSPSVRRDPEAVGWGRA